MDITRLPTELVKLPSVSKQLKLDELSTLTKMAVRGAVVPASVITQAPPPTASVIAGGNSTVSSAATAGERMGTQTSQKLQSSSSSKKERVMQEAKRVKQDEKLVSGNPTQFSHAYSTTPTTSLVTNSGLRLQQTQEGILVASNNAPYTTLAQTKSTVAGATTTKYAVKVPAGYVDSGQVYQTATLQLVPVSAGQQIMVWPQAMMQQQQTAKSSTQQLTVVQGSQLISMVDPSSVTTNAKGAVSTATSSSIITID